MNKSKVVLSSTMLALMLTGCSANEKEGANENLGLNRTEDNHHMNEHNNPSTRNINDSTDVRENTSEQYMVHEDLAKRIEDLKEVKRASVIVAGHHAYVGAVLKKGKLTKDVKNKIANVLRNADASLETVRVSTNPEFVEKVDGYVSDVKKGKPVEGFTDEFKNLVERVFPSKR